MIDIRVNPGRSVSITGHAGYAAKGSDIVCAAVSALFQTMCLADGIGFYDNGEEKRALAVRPGSEEIMRVFCRGLEQIAKQYPTFCRYQRERDEL